MKRFTIIVILAACAHATGGPDSPAHVVERFVAAFNHLDAVEMNALCAEDATAYLPMPDNAARVQGRQAIIAVLMPMFAAERQRHQGPEYLHLKAAELDIQVVGPAAIATFDVGTKELHSRRTLVIAHRHGTWRIIHLHASNLRVPAATS